MRKVGGVRRGCLQVRGGGRVWVRGTTRGGSVGIEVDPLRLPRTRCQGNLRAGPAAQATFPAAAAQTLFPRNFTGVENGAWVEAQA